MAEEEKRLREEFLRLRKENQDLVRDYKLREALKETSLKEEEKKKLSYYSGYLPSGGYSGFPYMFDYELS